MLAVIGVFVFLAISLSVCGLVIGVVVQTVFTIVAPLVTLLGLAFGFGSMFGKLITSLISFFIKFIFAIIIFCACVLPYVGQAWQNLYRAFPDIVNNIGWHIENIRETLEEAINEGVNQHSQWLIYIWGLILVPIYYISNQIQNAARNNERNEDFAGDEYDGMGDRDDPPPYEENPSENHNVRNRVRPSAPPLPQGPGLYPDLRNLGNNDFHNEEANNNDNDIGNVYLNNNNMNRNQMDDNDERMCVICFSRERNVAVFPCGHTWLCEPCTNSVMSRNRLCPVCQTRIQEYRTIYI